MLEEKSYMRLLQKAMGFENIEEVKDCCVDILTEHMHYTFCFIDFETEDHLGVYYTHQDFSERFVLISKKYVSNISIVYKQDMIVEKPNVSEYI